MIPSPTPLEISTLLHKFLCLHLVFHTRSRLPSTTPQLRGLHIVPPNITLPEIFRTILETWNWTPIILSSQIPFPSL